jgi:periplasmic protein TonB
MSLFDKGWIDIVFEGRNKKYGAYKLRMENPKTTMIALACGAFFFSAVVAGPLIYSKVKETLAKNAPKEEEKIELVELPEEIVEAEVLPPPPPEVKVVQAPKSVVEEVKFKPLEAVDKKEIVEPIISKEDLKDATPSNQNKEADLNAGDINIDVYAGDLDKGVEAAPPSDEPVNFAALQVKPEFPGGIAKFYEYVQRNFRTPEVDRDTNLKITVSFIVERDGSITGIKVLKDPGYGAGKEAERVLKSVKTKWKPGIQNGKPVRANYILPIVIQVQAN